MRGKRAKLILLAILLGLVVLGSGALICRSFAVQDSELLRAEKLMQTGDYLQAAELYHSMGDEENALACQRLYLEQQYINSGRKMQQGFYAEALDGFEELGDYKQSREYGEACRYLWAGELVAEKKFPEARALYLDLGAYPGAAQALAQCDELALSHALELAKDFRLAEAGGIWRALDQYENCPVLLARAGRMESWLSGEERLLSEDRLYPNSYYDAVYVTELAYIVAPENCSADCRFFVYFPGGKDDEINIDFLLYYLMNPAPDTIAVFLRTNGIYDMRAKNTAALELLEKAAAERGVFPTEIISLGSSLGAYPAMASAVYSPLDMGMGVSCVLSLDAGDDWKSPWVLSRSQCLETAKNGTEFYLFESPWVGTDRAAIKTMVETGNKVILVGCQFDEHVRITLDAMGMGVIHWALGDRSQPCPLEIYTFTRLRA